MIAKTLAAFATVAVLAAGTLATTTSAEAGYRHYGYGYKVYPVYKVKYVPAYKYHLKYKYYGHRYYW